MRTVGRSELFQSCGGELVVAAFALKNEVAQYDALPCERWILLHQAGIGDPQT
jgi:hypothetical protein